MEGNFEEQAENLSQRVRHYFVTFMGRDPKAAYPWEVFQALSLALREYVMVNWASTVRALNETHPRRLYYLSMEYLPGRMLENNITNLSIHPLMKRVLEKLGYPYHTALAIEPDPGLGNGGLGRLASCFLDSLATQRYPATAYGLRYQYGIFEQQIWEGMQIEKPDCWLLNENPWGLRRDGSAKIVKFAGLTRKRINGHQEVVLELEDYEEVRALPFDVPIIGFSENTDYNVVTLRLWSTKESPHNFHLQRYNAGQIGPASENTALTDVLYPNDNHDVGKRIRLKQEFLLVSASLQDIIQRHLETFPDLSNFADKVRIQINDTHPALVVPELMRLLTQWHGFQWQKAFEMTQEVVSYTNHTILSEALEKWNKERLASLLPRQFWIIEQINQQLCEAVRKKYPGDEEKVRRLSMVEDGQIRMSHLAIYGSHSVNGVSDLHGEILKERVFKDFFEFSPEKFSSVTNGITQRHWLWLCNPRLSEFISARIGKGWLTDFAQIKNIGNFASDDSSLKEFLEIKQANKLRLIRYLDQHNAQRDLNGREIKNHATDLELDSLFAVQVKRIHEYKRQLMNALHLIMVYYDLLENPANRPVKRSVIVAGKAAAGYTTAKQIIQLFYALARKINHDHLIQNKLKIVFVENYSVTRAEYIIPAAELSEQISTAGFESSGTGNMKLAINGALTIGTEDGANIEMRESIGDAHWPFRFGSTASELESLRLADKYSPWDIYSNNLKIKQAVDALKNGTFALSESENEAFSALFDTLMLGSNGDKPDRYFVLHDLQSYYDTEQKVEALYGDKFKWAATAIHNIAGMGPFSSDNAINEYARRIWHIEPINISPSVRAEVQRQYDESTLKGRP